jgi:hypothetical protein
MQPSTRLKDKLKEVRDTFKEPHSVRLHRAVSWLKSAEESHDNADLQLVSLWIAFNACYGNPNDRIQAERQNFSVFIAKLVHHDAENRIYNLLWNHFSGPIRLLIDNQYLFKPFWDFHRGEIEDWKLAFEKSMYDATKQFSNFNVAGTLEVVLNRLYVLRNQLIHGGATFNSSINRESVKNGNNMLQLLIPVFIDIMIENHLENWGEIYYPVVR